MPTRKDLKRRVRARMKKTQESYTAARAQLLEKKAPRPGEYARLAGIKDDTVKAKTGCTWERWVAALDRAGAMKMSHRDIARHVAEKYEIGDWWAQTVTVGYERIRGLRDIGQQREGTYEASKSKTITVPIAKLYRAFSTKRIREHWLPGVDLTIRTSTREKSMRITWEDESSVEAYFTAKGDAKSQVALQHRKLPNKAAAEKMKQFWGQRLLALSELLRTSG